MCAALCNGSKRASRSLTDSIFSYAFYDNYHGHTISHLNTLYSGLKSSFIPSTGGLKKSIIYLAGDSSLDNKYWLENNRKPAMNGYELILDPPIMKQDIAYHLNSLLINSPYIAINCAVEESTVGIRSGSALLPQDEFIRDHITSDDILIVSVGGNDIALRPSISTIWNMSLLTFLNSKEKIEKTPKKAWGLEYFIKLFGDNVRDYIKKLIIKSIPRLIIINMIYYPDEKKTGSWADRTLGLLGYNNNPLKLQTIIQKIYQDATSKIFIDGTTIIPFPLYQCLDGKDSTDYVARVEPSIKGGLKMAQSFITIIQKYFNDNEQQTIEDDDHTIITPSSTSIANSHL